MPKTAPRESSSPARSDWRSVASLVERINQGAKSPTITAHAVRHYVRFADKNGLAPHIRRLGRKILISESGFNEWIETGDQG